MGAGVHRPSRGRSGPTRSPGWRTVAAGEVDAHAFGSVLTGAETLDLAAALVGQVRMVAEQAAAFGTDSPEQALNATLGALVAGHKDRFPALAAALADTAGATDQALDFGVQRILDGVGLA